MYYSSRFLATFQINYCRVNVVIDSVPARMHYTEQNAVNRHRFGLLEQSPCGARPSSAQFCLRPYSVRDQSAVFALLHDLPMLYPGGGAWLERRLEDVLQRRARCTLAVTANGPIGIVIETPKERGRLKLSTIFVDFSFRGIGVASSLMTECRRIWMQKGVERVHVTADLKRVPTLLPLLRKNGFRLASVVYERYGPSRHEAVFNWSLDGQDSDHVYSPSVCEGNLLGVEAA